MKEAPTATIAAASQKQPIAQLSGVHKRFGKQEVLRGIDLELTPGRITGLLGPSGCGKTTIVNILVGTHLPSSGNVTVLGEEPPFKHARSHMGFMPQSEALYLDLTASENLRFFGSLYGLSRKQLDTNIERALDLVHLENDRRKVVANYSGGMKRRLSLAIALLHDPKLLILDEPTIGLDPKHRVELWKGFRQRASDGTALLITTHVMDEAMLCDRLLMIHDGRVIAQGTPDELIAHHNSETLEQAFLTFEATAEKDTQDA
ncbi:MAG: ABC transporter ATP-binding protein [Coriobacteriia bacterium]|nr:ABC transporter ATP-binding protein [Coriobacteriia bacterium]